LSKHSCVVGFNGAFSTQGQEKPYINNFLFFSCVIQSKVVGKNETIIEEDTKQEEND